METPLKTVNTQNLASLLVWQICQEYQNTLNQKGYWGARLQKMVGVKKTLSCMNLFLLYLLVAHWLMSLAPSPSPTIFLDYVSGSIIGMAVISCLAILWVKQRVGHYQQQIEEINKWVRFSNFRVYEERGSGDLILLMQKSYCELAPAGLPTPYYRYRISLPR